MLNMELTPNGYKFIKQFEGCVLHPYLDQGGVPTIGWGMTHYPDGTKVTMSDKSLTQEDADAMFQLLVIPYSDGVIEALGSTVQLNTNQLCALTDFAYNCGLGAFKQSLLCEHVKNGNVTEQDFTVYDHVGQKEILGLFNRRKAEYDLYVTPIINVPNKTNNMKTTWTKFYDSATKTVVTYFNNDKVLQNDGMTFDFATSDEAVEKSTSEDFIFWDNVAIGSGKLTA